MCESPTEGWTKPVKYPLSSAHIYYHFLNYIAIKLW